MNEGDFLKFLLELLKELLKDTSNVNIFGDYAQVQQNCVAPCMYGSESPAEQQLANVKEWVETRLGTEKAMVPDKFVPYITDERQRYLFLYHALCCTDASMLCEVLYRLLSSSGDIDVVKLRSGNFLGLVNELVDLNEENLVDRLQRGLQKLINQKRAEEELRNKQRTTI
jgi:hypothetical protein